MDLSKCRELEFLGCLLRSKSKNETPKSVLYTRSRPKTSSLLGQHRESDSGPAGSRLVCSVKHRVSWLREINNKSSPRSAVTASPLQEPTSQPTFSSSLTAVTRWLDHVMPLVLSAIQPRIANRPQELSQQWLKGMSDAEKSRKKHSKMRSQYWTGPAQSRR